MKQGVKHLIECHCVLPQYRDHVDIIYHKFVVFSEIDEDDNVIMKYAQCNNCGVIHRIIDIGKSEIAIGREASAALVDVSDVKLSLPQQMISVLENYKADIATWEHAQWIILNERWGSTIVLTSEQKASNVEGKCLVITGPSTLKVESFVRPLAFPTK